MLILKSLSKNIEIENLSDSDDSVILDKYLRNFSNYIDIHHAGTAMRFLTAFLSIQENKEFEITGSERIGSSLLLHCCKFSVFYVNTI